MILTIKPIRRHYVTGFSKGPQGADGVSILAREAYLSMLAATWQDDIREATMPVHEYKRDPPAGQAYKCVWGYDGDKRTDQAACGAECYTFKIPADALDDTNADGGADINSIVLRLAGDRYLDHGVSVWCELSSSPTPSPIAVAMASGGGIAYLATANQTDAAGEQIAPNKRSGVEEEITVDMSGAASEEYLHVHLFLADYLGVRGSWIEGGAMFASEAVSIDFSRDVAQTDSDSEISSLALNVGRAAIGSGSGQLTPSAALQVLPRVSLWENFSIVADGDAVAALPGGAQATGEFDTRVADMLAFLLSDPLLWAQSPMVADDTGIEYGGVGKLAFNNNAVGFCCMCAHGLTGGKLFRGMRFENALPDSIPYRLLVYGVSGDIAIASSASNLHFATPLVYWADLLSRQFRSGEAKTLRVLTDSSLAAQDMASASADDTAEVSVQPLATRSVSASLSRVDFAAPFVSGDFSSILIALIPEGAPNDTESTPTQYQATATRDISAVVPVGATRSARSANVTLTGGAGTILFRSDESVATTIRRIVPNAGISNSGGSPIWNSAVMGMANYTRRNNIVNATLTKLAFSFVRSGRTFTFDSTSGDPLPDFTCKADVELVRPHSYDPGVPDNQAALTMVYIVHIAAAINVTAHAPDGATANVTITFPDDDDLALYPDDPSTPANWSIFASKPATNNSFDNDIAEMVYAARITLPGHDYSFATSSNEGVTAAVTQSGTITFERAAVVYTAAYSQTGNQAWSVRNKSTGTLISVGNDRTETGTVYGNVGAVSRRLKFSGSDGSSLWATASFPAAQIRGNVAFQARSAYSGAAQGVGSVYNDGVDHGSGTAYAAGLQGTAATSEGWAASVEIDPGLITLFE